MGIRGTWTENKGEGGREMERRRKAGQEGEATGAKEKVRGRGEEGRRGPGSAGRAALGEARGTSGLLRARGLAAAGAPARRARGRAAGSRGLGCARAGCARQERQAPRSGAFVLCRGKQAARPGAGLALAPPLGHRGLGGLATRETGPLSPLLSRAGLRDRRSRRGAEKRRGGWGGERGRPGHGF